jgi:peptide deformylase
MLQIAKGSELCYNTQKIRDFTMTKQHKCSGHTLPLVIWPDKRLKQKSEPVKVVDDALRAELDEMVHATIHNEGVGLSGVQVGIMKNIFVVDVDYCISRYPESATDNPEMKEIYSMINAEIIEASKEKASYQEGCLSLPGLDFPQVERPAVVKVKYLDYNGKEQVATVKGLLSSCIQHEMDHCEGVLVLDHLTPLKRQMQIKKIEKCVKNMMNNN